MNLSDAIKVLSDKEILALTLIGEARGEPIESIIAVGCVVRNRLLINPVSYKTYTDVCLKPFQFSCWNSNDKNKALLEDIATKMINDQNIDDIYLRQCIFIANGIIDFDLVDSTKSAEYYVVSKLLEDPALTPSWAKRRRYELVKGNHTFFSI